jgi:imidazole glycerol-phosphate synthase subunit HisH
MIRIVDYGVGNIQAFLNLFNRLGLKADRACEISDLIDASHLILPGVGHFDHAMYNFNKSGLREPLETLVLKKNKPLLGVCVGMQMLANNSEEGALPGLGWIPGSVQSLKNRSQSSSMPLPHMGWNTLNVINRSSLFPTDDIDPPEFYFLHSYFFNAINKSDVIATTEYGIEIDAVVHHKNVFGMQCHPEKSHRWGENFLHAFAEL